MKEHGLNRKELKQIWLNFTEYADRSSIEEIKQLKQLFIDGKINGCNYGGGEFEIYGNCFCWVGSLAKIRQVDYRSLDRNVCSEFENFILSLREGDNPNNNEISQQVVKWIDKYLSGKLVSNDK